MAEQKMSCYVCTLQAFSLLHNASLMLCVGLTLIVHTQPLMYTWPYGFEWLACCSHTTACVPAQAASMTPSLQMDGTDTSATERR